MLLNSIGYLLAKILQKYRRTWNHSRRHKPSKRIKTLIFLSMHTYDSKWVILKLSLKCLPKLFTGICQNIGSVTKILHSLPRSWEPEATTIVEVEDLAILKLQQDIKSIHDMINSTNEKKKKKVLGLKASLSSRKWWWWSWSRGSSSTLWQVQTVRHPQERRCDKAPKDDSDDVIKCYKCRKPGYMMANCLLLNSKSDKFKRKKVTCATWMNYKEVSLKKTQKKKIP